MSTLVSQKRFQLLASLALAALLVGGFFVLQKPDAPAGESNLEMTAAWRKRILSIQEQGILPLIDTHSHIGGWDTLDIIPDVVDFMDELGVALVTFIPDDTYPLQGSAVARFLRQEYPRHFIPTTVGGRTESWIRQEGSLIEKIEEEVRSGTYPLMGEFEIRRSARIDRGIYRLGASVPLDFPWVHRIFSLSSETGVPFQLHIDPYDEELPLLEKMLAQYPDAFIIWAHMGIVRDPSEQTVYSPDYIDSLLIKFPRLYFDITPRLPGDRHIATLQDPSGILLEEWKSLLEKHPSRFTIGIDIAPHKFREFPEEVQNARAILGQLSDATAERIAYQNAWHLLTKSEWKSPNGIGL